MTLPFYSTMKSPIFFDLIMLFGIVVEVLGNGQEGEDCENKAQLQVIEGGSLR